MALTLPDSTLDSYYQNLVANYKPQEISYQDITTEQKTESDLASAIAAYLEPYKKKSVSSIESSLQSQRAAADADAASRGMGTSTYLSDLKSRMSRQAQSDISNIESDFVSSIGQRTAEAYQNQLNRVLNVNQVNAANRLAKEQWNAQEKNRAEAEAWNRAFILAQYAPASSGSSGGGSYYGGSGSGSGSFTANDIAASGSGSADYGVTQSWADALAMQDYATRTKQAALDTNKKKTTSVVQANVKRQM